MSDPEGIETQLADISGLTIDEIMGLRRDRLASAVKTMLRQIERHRVNIGGSDPPGRAD